MSRLIQPNLPLEEDQQSPLDQLADTHEIVQRLAALLLQLLSLERREEADDES